MNAQTLAPLNPNELTEAIAEHGARRVMGILSMQTCGEACWHAREDVCRCECGGKNHGCLRTAGGVQPARSAKIGGDRYTLAAVGRHATLYPEANRINCESGYASVEKPFLYERATPPYWMQYKYTYSETQDGSPARMKPATKDQLAKWPELEAYRETGAYLLWVRVTMPERPAQLVIDKETGLPLADQNPPNRYTP